ncbi:DEAD/DEAH box helicase family protein [Shewanella xiamenensis]|uniref:LPD38 domain-containing protein n=1 Tax=Shewanella xiamenensis TaxID=332186 RepID=UPI00217E77F5|nr:LPD38 domain-containing protein [Shewanella xiamenensis]MCT8857532.1 DEAD/DEAH box helicase family protein [Shewanella xiamenensis]UWG66449.1 DEAD/DEAH box helicase family protein [Shewanella xiamenensis]
MSLLGFDPNKYRTTTTAQTKPQEQGRFGDVVDSFQAGAASGLGGIFDFIGADGIAKSLYGIANDQYSQMSSRGQEAMGKQMFQTNAQGETELGEGMTDLDTWLLQMANVAGQFVPTAVPGAGAAGLATKALSLGSKGAKVAQAVGMGATGGSAATGQAMDQARQEVLKMPDQVLADSELFKQTFLNIDAQSPELDDVSKWNQAKAQLAEQVASEVRSDPKSLLANFAASAIGDPIIGRALTGVRLAKSGAFRSALAGGITEGTTEATQAGVSQYAVDSALSQIDQRDPMAGVKLAALNEGIIGAGFGASAGGIGGIANRNPVDREPAKNPAADPIRETNPTVAGAMDADAQQAANRRADMDSMAQADQAQQSQQPNYDQPTAARRAGMGDTMQTGRFGDEAIARDNAMKGRSFPTVPEQFNPSPLTQAMDSVQGLADNRREGEWLPPEGQGRSPVTGLLAAPFIDGENLNRQRTRDTMAAQPTNLIGQSDTIFANDGRARQAAQQFADTTARQTETQPKQITDKGIIFAPDTFSPKSQGINVKSNNTPFASAKEALISKGARAAKREGAKVQAVKFGDGWGWTANGDATNADTKLDSQQNAEQAAGQPSPEPVTSTPKGTEAKALTAASGKVSKVFTPSNKEIETEYQLIEADELIASNDFTGKVDPRYPASRQPRDRSRASSQLQIAAIANDPNPARLADSAESDRGAPIVSGNIVESGNGRSIGLKEAYARGSAEKYRKYLVDNAEQFGFTNEQISAMKSPVLVRQRITDLTEDEIRAFTVDSNKSASLELSPMESAKADSETITDDMLDILSVPDNGNVLSSDNRQFIQAFTKAMNQQELARYLAADGSFNKDFANRVERAIFAKGYNNDKLLELVAESATTEQKNVLNSLANVAGKMARLRSVNQDVWSEVSNILSDATALVMRAKRDGKALSELTSQGDMMTGYVLSEVDTMATAIDANIRSGKKITSMLDGVITSLINANINQGSMFDTEQLTPQQAIAYVKQQQQSQQTPRASADLFGANPPKLPRSGEGQTDSVQTTGRAEPEVTSNTVSKNTVFTEEAAEEARKKLRAMLGTFNSGFNPEVMQAGITLAGYHIEKGARTFAAYAKAMIADMGDAVKPYLKSWYMGVKYDPRAAAFDGMDNAATVDSFDLAELENDNDQYSAINQESDSQGGADTGSPANESNANDRRKQVGRATAVNGGRGGSQEQLTNAMDDGVPTADSASSIQPIRDEKSRLANDVPRDSDSIGRLPDSTAGIQPEPVGAKATANIVKQAPEVSVKAKPLASVGEYRSADKEQIRASMPFLTPGQVEDVAFTENRFSQPDGTGVLFTNGTGTGKTFLGLGVVRRFIEQGKENVLVLVPKQPIVDAWVGAGRKFFDLNINAIKDTSDSGQGVSVTTYANLIANPGLIGKRDFDLIIADESHYLSSDKDGSITKALKAVRAIAKMPGTSLTSVNAKNPELAEKIAEGVSAIEQLRAGNAFAGKAHDDIHEWLDPLVRKRSELEAEERKYLASIPVSERPKTMLLSATPLAYEKNVVIGQGLLYDWNEGMEDNSGAGYNSGGNFERFMMQHFGYRMRYNKLTEPEAEVDRGLMQRQFNAWLKQRGVLSGRTLDSDFDYDRRFVMTESAIGKRVDDALSWLRENDGEDIAALREKIVGENFNYHSRMYFLEAIKAREALPIIRDHLALGRRVVVMHDFKQGGVVNPFWLSNPEPEIVGAYERFRREFSDLIRSFQSLPSPIQTITKAFPDALVYNGDVSGKNRVAMQEVFNSDEPGTPNLIIAQGDAMREGVSIHDTSGKAQRVLIHLGMPGKPTAAIQQEGRIYRTGQASDAIFRYLTIGTSWERTAFASTIATRAATAENLAMGEQARGLKQSFINAYEEADDYPAGMEGEGKGGKAADAAMAKLLTPWDLAKSLYFGTKKYGKGRSADREGVDYFATPEPVGMKMVQLADIRPGEKVLEPSAGHGAIARWFPENTESRAIEPSEGLSSRMALHFVGDIVSSRFEDHNTINKYDAIVMNPPYGVGGKTAAEHVEKAIKHLRPWGRVVALIPTGPAADKRFDALLYGDDNKDIHLAANIKIPSVTFERAGTSVSTRIIVLEKVPPKYEGQLKTATRDYSNIEDIKSLFERMESLEIHPRGKPVEEVSEVTATIDSAEPLTTDDINSTNFEYTGETYTTKSSGKVQQVITLRERVDYDKYKALQNIAKKHGGWNRGQKFMFNTGAKLKAFAEEADTELNGNSAPEMLYSKTAKGVNRGGRKFSQAEAQRAVDDVMKRLSGAAGIRVNLFTSQEEFLSRFNVPTMAMQGQTIFGAYDDKRNSAYLVLDNFESIDELRSTLVHEVLAHGGLHTVIGQAKYQEFVKKLTSTRSRAELKDLWARIDKDYKGASDAVKAEEVFANFVQNQPERGTLKAWWFELKQWLRRQFEGLGILRKNHARNEMEDMIKAIVRGFDKRKQRMDRAGKTLAKRGTAPSDIAFQMAYHGTPHTWDNNRVSLNHIGSGEGAQTYGWGAYFAGNREVAESYRRGLAGRDTFYKGQRVADMPLASESLHANIVRTAANYYNVRIDTSLEGDIEGVKEDTIQDFESELEQWLTSLKEYPEHRADIEPEIQRRREALEASKKFDYSGLNHKTNGNLYQVDVPEDSDLLSFDDAVEKQPKAVREKLANLYQQLGEELPTKARGSDIYDQIGNWIADGKRFRSVKSFDRADKAKAFYLQQLHSRRGKEGLIKQPTVSQGFDGDWEVVYYDDIEGMFGLENHINANRTASLLLNKQGIPGLRYRDAGSRGVGMAASYNYVIWDESVVKTEALNDVRFSMAFDDAEPDNRTAKQKLGLEEEAEQTLKEKITENYRNTADTLKQSSFWSRLNEGIFDGLHGIKKAEEAAGITDPNKMGYVSARLASGLSDVLHGVFHYGAPMWKDGIIQRKADTKGLLEVFGMLPKGELNNWLAWMGANRAKQLKAEGRENNLSQADIDELLALADGKEALFEQVRAEYNKINSAVLDVAQEAGLISEAQRAGFDEEYYVPFFREQDVDPEMQDIASMVTAPFTKKGIAGQSAKIKALKGGKQSTKDLLENIILRQSTMLDAALKNKAMLEVADNLDGTQFMTQVDSPEFAKLSQRELNSIQRVKVMRDGQAVAYAVTDPALLRGLIAVNDVGSQALFNRMGRSAKRFLTAGVTLSPDFIFKNFIRDAAHAWMINKDDFKFGTDSIKGLKKAFKEDEAYRDLIFSGAAFQGGYVHGADPEAAAQQIRRALAQKGLAKGQIDSYMDSLVTSGSKLFEKYRNLSDKVENANRLSTYEAGLASGKSRRQAAFEAKDLMDYAMKGNFALISTMIDFLPFFNARLQGMYKLARASAAGDNDKVLKVLSANLAMKGIKVAAFSLALAAMNDDDERYQELPDWDKDANWHFWLGDDHFRIPKPFELGVIFGTLPERLLGFGTGSQTGSDLGRAVGNAVFNTMALNPIPQIALPVVEVMTNKSFFKGTAIEGMGDENRMPGDRYNAYTSDTAREIGQALNVSPKKIEHLVNGYAGTLGGYVLAMSDMMARQMLGKEKPETPISRYPIIKAFYGGDDPKGSTYYQNEFYKALDAANQAYGSYKRAAEEQDSSRMMAVLEDNRDKLGVRIALNRVQRQVSALSKQAEMVNNSSMSPSEKREKLDAITRQKNAIYQSAYVGFNLREW